jgi:hypothetical protein
MGKIVHNAEITTRYDPANYFPSDQSTFNSEACNIQRETWTLYFASRDHQAAQPPEIISLLHCLRPGNEMGYICELPTIREPFRVGPIFPASNNDDNEDNHNPTGELIQIEEFMTISENRGYWGGGKG